MRTTALIARWTMVAGVVLGVGGCRELTQPEDNPYTLGSGGATAAKAGETRLKAYAHAIHVEISGMIFGAVFVDRYSFLVERKDGDVKGRFEFYQVRRVEGADEAVVIASGPMVCVDVVGNRARVGGRVDQTTFPEGIPLGSEITWSITDNGNSSKAMDTASQPLGNDAEAYCGFGGPYAEHPVEPGKVRVKEL
jgi:hypothetical protein